MSQFFIRRPIFAWVIALFIILFGVLSIPKLPIARFPSVAPPQISITAMYPGATPKTLNDSVVTLIEREMSGVKNLLYYSSSSDTSGSATVTATFKPGTDVELAQVDVQNKIKAIESRLPQPVRQQGLMVDAASSGFLMIIGLNSPNHQYSEIDLSDYMTRHVIEEIKRVDGVGKIQNFGAEKAMRIWVDPNRLVSYGLSIKDVNTAIQNQNLPISPGRIGDTPALKGQQITIPLTAQGQLETVEQFKKISLRSNKNGATVLLSDVAHIEVGAQSYSFAILENGNPSTAIAIQMSPNANAVKTAEGVKAKINQLSTSLPDGMKFSIPYDTAPFVKVSIQKVITTLIEAMVLVFIVMFIFLHNVRYTLIPAIVAPIALLGTFSVMLLAGFSINVLTMFGMVLAIGIIVDDAIVVIENVERIMVSEGLSPADATSKAMKEITNPIIGITLVLAAVFLPMALANGSVGIIYRQFTITMSVSILFSAFLALTLTPALCATMLKPIDKNHVKKGVFAWFDRSFEKLNNRYEHGLFKVIKHKRTAMLFFIGIVVALLFCFKQVPTAFMPEEDQGWFMTSIQLPSDATQERTKKVVTEFQEHLNKEVGIQDNMAILGFGFSGSGQNTAMYFTNLLPFEDRKITAQQVVDNANTAMADSSEGQVMSVLPPAIDELGSSSGFSLQLQDVGNIGMQALAQAQDQLLSLSTQSKKVVDVYSDGLPDGNSVQLKIDREKLQILGVNFSDVTDIISTSMGSMYINDFPNQDRMQQVIVQLDAKSRMSIDDILQIKVNSQSGKLISMSEIITPVWQYSPQQYNRYNGRPSLSVTGSPAPGISSGQAMSEMENLIKQLPKGVGYEWSGISLEEKQAESQTIFLLLLSMLVVFLVLAGLYESWSIPLSVMLVVPLGLIGAFIAVMIRGMPNDIFFKVGMITIIGLSAKNAILIVEFAKALREDGMSLVKATVEAAKLRLRPILMTSLAFTCGVIPLVFASGASSETQKAIGTGVFGGMISATLLALVFVPIFFIIVMGTVDKFSKQKGSN
ncbi:multidrug efflux RND transporter permease subunit [Acinetobacter pittii]|uniref:Efflux pump membrane transporter n=4 Tax=Acinetobacter TaxID=469 RepID=A0A6G5PN02_ACIBA|nr:MULTISPECIES: efflux RND transporter permease subunit [Acinetobacter]MDP6003912.1 efflux RND transporter permease subunit [Acinetobacter bereziniae]MDP7900781.1 efflux RND transporter permease subunit [Acinetobacter pittii]MDQ9011773.1 efflux RND transporter permease subunit [Acinetobacter gerneri]MDQ9015901.1 efflux RND transporter permease subunit [Acinetobacter gerneri]MDQ9027049.1 efflux RND transporter permease subunit [Acinetobacter gerneri]